MSDTEFDSEPDLGLDSDIDIDDDVDVDDGSVVTDFDSDDMSDDDGGDGDSSMYDILKVPNPLISKQQYLNPNIRMLVKIHSLFNNKAILDRLDGALEVVHVKNEDEDGYEIVTVKHPSTDKNIEIHVSNLEKYNAETYRRYLNPYEKARIIGTRAEQIASGAPTTIKITSKMTNPIDIALEELKKGKLPLTIITKDNEIPVSLLVDMISVPK